MGAGRSEAASVNFITDFGFNGRHAYFFVALDKGYYKAAGLDVQILAGQGSADAIKKVGVGDASIGFADAGSLVLARSNDGVPVKLVSVIYAKPPQAIFALAESGIKVPKDLEGKTIADTAGSANKLVFDVYAKATGIDSTKVKWIVATGSALPSLLAMQRVDAVGQFIVGQALLAAATSPKPIVGLAYKDAGLTLYGNGLIASENTLKSDPAMVKAFVQATLKGLQDSFADPAGAAAILAKYHKEIATAVAESEIAAVTELAIVPGQPLGHIDPAAVAETIDIMTDALSLKNRMSPEALYAPGFTD